jgi:hypothetical protein
MNVTLGNWMEFSETPSFSHAVINAGQSCATRERAAKMPPTGG